MSGRAPSSDAPDGGTPNGSKPTGSTPGDGAAGTSAAPRGGPLTLAARLAVKDHVVPLARDLGRWARDRAHAHDRGERELAVRAKSSPGDVVTEVDVEVQRRLADALGAAYPGFALLGEEDLGPAAGPTADPADRSGGAPLWVIDPIDGTHNFVRGYPGFCVSIGLVEDGESVLGVIYDAATDSVFWAVKGGGAWHGDQRLHVSAPTALDHALLTTGFTTASAANPVHQRVFLDLASSSAGMRQSGSACRDLCFVASGRIDLYWQLGVRAWDVAAGIVLVTEAGGTVALDAGGNGWVGPAELSIIAGGEALMETVSARIKALG